jgi:DNA-binding transcriptional LysR family regulator
MELRTLRAFVEVSRCGGFSAAARVLHTTQSTVSKAIQQLEHDCGAPLVERLGRGIRLTEAGDIVIRRARTMLAEQNLLTAELGELRGLKRGKLKLGLPLMASSVLFAGPMADYRKRYPGIEVELRETGISRLEEGVRSGEIEIGASLEPIAAEFDWRRLRDEPLMALLSTDHPLSERTSLRLAELAGHPTVLFEEGIMLNAILQTAYRRRKMALVDAGRSGNADFILAMVAAGLGVAFLPRVVVESRDHASVRAVAVEDEDMRWRIALIWRRDRSLSAAAQRWLDLVVPPGSAPTVPPPARAASPRPSRSVKPAVGPI